MDSSSLKSQSSPTATVLHVIFAWTMFWAIPSKSAGSEMPSVSRIACLSFAWVPCRAS